MHIPAADTIPREIKSDLCATEARAEADARRHLTAEVQSWLSESGVEPNWQPPKRLIDEMILGRPAFEPVKVDDLEVIRASLTADFSEPRKEQFLQMHRRQTGWRRLGTLGGGLAVALIALASLSGYIRADEATKGYYTNRLRLLAAAGVGAASVVVYRAMA